MATAPMWLKAVTTTYTDKLESGITASGNRAGKGSPSQDTCKKPALATPGVEG